MQHAGRAVLASQRVLSIFFGVVARAVSTPLPDIPVQVKETPSVRREVAYRRGLLPIDALLALAVGVAAIVVGLVGGDRLAEMEGHRGARPAPILPFGLRRQPEPLARFLAQLLGHLLAVVP